MNNVNLKELLGPIWSLYEKENVYEIIVNSADEVSIHHGNEEWLTQGPFQSKIDFTQLIARLKKYYQLSEEQSHLHQYLNEHTVVSLTLPPLSLSEGYLVITKLPRTALSLDDYLDLGAVDQESHTLLKSILASKQGILCSGPSGSGKTTLFNTLLNELPAEERIVSIEVTPSLLVKRKSICRLTPRNSKHESVEEVLNAAANMRGDYFALNELGGVWVAPYLELVRDNGKGLALIHGQNPHESLNRLINQTVLSSNGLSLKEASFLVAATFKYLVFQECVNPAARAITSIHECVFSNEEVTLRPIYQRQKV